MFIRLLVILEPSWGGRFDATPYGWELEPPARLASGATIERGGQAVAVGQ